MRALLQNIWNSLVDLTATVSAGFTSALTAIGLNAPASTALSTGTWTGTKAGYLDAPISGRLGAIKNIYRGVISINLSNTTNTATITAVVIGKSELRLLGTRGTDAAGTGADIYLELTDSTTITATRSPGCSGVSKASYELIEFN